MSGTKKTRVPPAEKVPQGNEAATAAEPREARSSDERFLAHLATAAEMVGGGRFREAEVEALRALSGLPSDLRALNLLALVRFKLGRFDEARATYREVADLAPNDGPTRRNLGLLALKLEHLDEAIPDLEMAARLTPGDQQAWSYLGYAYAKKNETVRAAAAFRRAGQDQLAAELEHAATVRKPSSGPKLAALAPVTGAGEAGPVRQPLILPPPAARAPTTTPEAVVIPAPVAVPSNGTAAPAVAVAPVAAPAIEEPSAPVELAPVSLLGFVLSRLGMGATPPAPHGEALRIGVGDEAFVRAGAALAAVGVRFEPAFRRMQGRASKVPLSGGGAPFFRLIGPGEVWVAGEPGRWQAVTLDDDILYVREDRVLAFDGGVSWEAGAVPGDGLPMLQFRGRGCVVLRLDALPVAIKVTEDRPAFVGRAHLLGWVGRLVTHKQRAAGPAPFELACQGEGVVLFDPPRVAGA